MTLDRYADVPAADSNAEIDDHWLAMRSSSALPSIYLPPSMVGRRSGFTQATAAVLIAVFLLATSAGVCLTYGPDVFGR